MRTHHAAGSHGPLAVALLIAAGTIIGARPARAQFSATVDASGAFDNVSFAEGGETRGAGSIAVDAGHALLCIRSSCGSPRASDPESNADWRIR